MTSHFFNFLFNNLSFCFKVKDKEKETLEKIQEAKLKVRNEIRDLKDRLKLAQENMQYLKEKVETDDMGFDDAI